MIQALDQQPAQEHFPPQLQALYHTVVQRVRQLIDERQTSVSALARHLGISRATFYAAFSLPLRSQFKASLLFSAASAVGLRLVWVPQDELSGDPATKAAPAAKPVSEVVWPPAVGVQARQPTKVLAPPLSTASDLVSGDALLADLPDEVVRRLLGQIGNIAEVAKILGCHAAFLRQRANHAGIVCPDFPPLSPAQAVLDAFLGSRDVRQVAQQLGMTPAEVGKRLRQVGVDPRPASKGGEARRERAARNRDILARLHRGESAQAVAQALRCSISTVYGVRRAQAAQPIFRSRHRGRDERLQQCVAALAELTRRHQDVEAISAALPHRLDRPTLVQMLKCHHPAWWGRQLRRTARLKAEYRHKRKRMLVQRARRLRQALRRARLSSRMLADRAGLSRATLALLCSGQAGTTHWAKLAQVLGVSVDWLEHGIEGPAEPREQASMSHVAAPAQPASPSEEPR